MARRVGSTLPRYVCFRSPRCFYFWNCAAGAAAGAAARRRLAPLLARRLARGASEGRVGGRAERQPCVARNNTRVEASRAKSGPIFARWTPVWLFPSARAGLVSEAPPLHPRQQGNAAPLTDSPPSRLAHVHGQAGHSDRRPWTPPSIRWRGFVSLARSLPPSGPAPATAHLAAAASRSSARASPLSCAGQRPVCLPCRPCGRLLFLSAPLPLLFSPDPPARGEFTSGGRATAGCASTSASCRTLRRRARA